MKNAAQTAIEADEKTIQRLRDALVFNHGDRELLGPETTLRVAFAVCNKLGLIPRSTEQAEVFLNAMRAAGHLTVVEVNDAKWELLGAENSAGHTFAPDDESEKGVYKTPERQIHEIVKAAQKRRTTLRQIMKEAAAGGPQGLLTIPGDEPVFNAGMDLHEVLTVRDGVWVIKVPGGWIYTLSLTSGECSSVFVPEPPVRRSA